MQTRKAPAASGKSLENQILSLDCSLEKLLDIDPNRHVNNLEYLATLGNDCKDIFSEMSNVTFKLIEFRLENGSANCASKLRSKLRDTKKEVRAFISIINSFLESNDFENISFDLNSTVSPNDFERSVNIFNPGRSSSPIDQLQGTDSASADGTPTFKDMESVGSRIPSNSATRPNRMMPSTVPCNLVKKFGNIAIEGNFENTPAVSFMTKGPQSSIVGSANPRLHLREQLYNPSPLAGLAEHTKRTCGALHNSDTVLRPPTINPPSSLVLRARKFLLPQRAVSDVGHPPPVSISAELNAPVRSALAREPIVSSVISNDVPYPAKFEQTNVAHHFSASSNIYSAPRPSVLQRSDPSNTRVDAKFPISTNAVLDAPPLGSLQPVARRSNAPAFAPLQAVSSYESPLSNQLPYTHYNDPAFSLRHPAPVVPIPPISFPYPVTQPTPIVPNSEISHLTHHLVRSQLYEKHGDPFSGEPHKYYAWVNIMNRKMANLNLDPWDVLNILHENTTGKPRKVLHNYLIVGAVDPQQSLSDAWDTLYQRFGTGERIDSSISSMLDSFSPITNRRDHERLGELVDLCRVIAINIPYSTEMQKYNLPSGINLIWSKLPESLQERWMTFSNNYKDNHYGSPPRFADLIAYLDKRYSEISDPAYFKSLNPEPNRTKQKSVTTFKTDLRDDTTPSASTDVPPIPTRGCVVHPNSDHKLEDCHVFRKKSYNEKKSIIIEHKRCFVCLGNHLKRYCKSDITCDICKKQHLTILHADRHIPNFNTKDESISSNLCTGICGGDTAKSCSKVLLVDVTFPSKSNKSFRCYAILDEQSSSTFVDPKIVDFFEVELPTRQYKIRTLSGLITNTTGMEVQGLRVKGVSDRKAISLSTAFTNNFIPDCKNEVATPSIVSKHSHIRHLAKKFPAFDDSAEVLMLIGRDSGDAMATQCFGYKAPYAHRTPIGWALVGSVCKTNGPPMSTVLKVHVDERAMEHWNLTSSLFKGGKSLSSDPFAEYPDDELPDLSKEDVEFIYKVSSSIRVNEEGHLAMALPFKKNIIDLPNNRTPVYCRMVNTLSKLRHDPDKLQQCLNSMKSNIIAKHVEEIPQDELVGPHGKTWYVPVFTVTHPKKQKVRIVWDSKASYKGISLNNQLLSGPDVNTQLATVLMRFRTGEVAFTADIESMFFAFHLEPEDRDFTRFFWWKENDPTAPLVEYRANRHIFGNTSSPSLANLGLRFAVLNSDNSTERARHFIFNNFYVDDGCGSASSDEDAIAILNETRQSLMCYKIHLHKITSNSSKVLSAFPPAELGEPLPQDFNFTKSHRTLGVEWCPSSDLFIVRTNVPQKPFTKRGTLATTNSLFDPLGFAAPIILKGRLLQRLLIPPKTGDMDVVSLDWDDPLPDRYHDRWEQWCTTLRENDRTMSIPRCYRPPGFGKLESVTLHVFSDASIEGTGHVMYLRSVSKHGQVHVSFVFATSRVPPRNILSVPRLELCAAFDASLSAYKICGDLGIKPNCVTLYSDSTVVLGYIANTKKSFTRYVTRRVQTIRKSFSLDQWRYVATHENPGDLASRPQSFESLSESCWFKGPAFLWSDLDERQPTPIDPDVHLPETDEMSSTLKTSTELSNSIVSSIASRVNSWTKLLNVVQHLFKFVHKLADRVSLSKGQLFAERSEDTFEISRKFIIISVQNQAFPDVISGKAKLPNEISTLVPFLDNDSILRVGGRLERSNFPIDVKHPLLLPGRHPVTKLLITHHHINVKHQGRMITHSKLREEGYYILHGSKTVKASINNCVICQKLRGKVLHQKMSDLPLDRLYESPPFTSCGLDVFGHFHASEGVSTRRTNSNRKVWAVVFICMVTKAVHIELLSNMDTASFILALRRFFSIRGNCTRLRSDRGTNFVGAHNQDAQIDLSSLQNEAYTNQCEWIFNPPKSSHFGGLWERSIRSFRKILDASLVMLGKRTPTREELHTFLCEAACIINNTPLYEVSSDPNDALPVSPAQLMTLKDSPNPPPIESFSEKDFLAYGSRRWRRVQALSDFFWQRWRKEYLQSLQQRQKWLKQTPNIKAGDIVLLKVNNTRRNTWPLARISAVKTSDDGLVRSVELVVPSGTRGTLKTFRRSIKDIVPILHQCEAVCSE